MDAAIREVLTNPAVLVGTLGILIYFGGRTLLVGSILLVVLGVILR